jgi:hypothetical protein
MNRRKTATFCVCGIKCREVQPGVFECPRCQKVIPPKGPENIGQLGEDFRLESISLIPEKAVVDEKATVQNATKTTKCDQCGHMMEDKCGAICPNCKWNKPCGLE